MDLESSRFEPTEVLDRLSIVTEQGMIRISGAGY